MTKYASIEPVPVIVVANDVPEALTAVNEVVKPPVTYTLPDESTTTDRFAVLVETAIILVNHRTEPFVLYFIQ